MVAWDVPAAGSPRKSMRLSMPKASGSISCTAGQAHDGKPAIAMLDALQPDAILLADRAYDSNAIRSLAAQKRAWANIPPKKNRTGSFSHSLRTRN
ncbi:MAG: transposase [Mesorhizobium sp.]|nr:MAG: transposase [Mesorhizobium sp.]